MSHAVVGARDPQIRQHRLAGQRLQRHRRDEMTGARRHDHVDADVGLDQQPCELSGLVGSDAAGQAEHDAGEWLRFRCQRAISVADSIPGREVYTRVPTAGAARAGFVRVPVSFEQLPIGGVLRLNAAEPKIPNIFWLMILLVIGGYFRIVAVQDTIVDNPLRADALDYYLSAHNLVHYGTYSRSRVTIDDPRAAPQPDAYRSPGVPLMIASFMSSWPNHDRILARVQWLNVALGLASIALIFFTASTVLPASAAFAVGLLTACSPHLISLTVYLLSETPGAFFVALLLMVTAIDVPTSPRARIAFFIVLGAVIGCMSLFRPVFLAFAPLIALAFPYRRDKLQALPICCLGAALVIAPWVLRNLINVPSGTATLFATTILEGSYPDFVFNGDKATFPYGSHFDPRFDALVMSLPATLQEVSSKLIANPGETLYWYLLEKPVYLFQWYNIDGADVFVYPITATPFWTNKLFMAAHAVYRNAHAVFLLLTVSGALAAWWKPAIDSLPPTKLPVLRMASLLLMFLYLVHIPFFVNTRYALPVYPAMYLLATFAVIAGWRLLFAWSPSLRPRT
jgi:hypothetical protein